MDDKKNSKKDNKGRNNINKKDHQLKSTSLVDKNETDKVESKNQGQNTIE